MMKSGNSRNDGGNTRVKYTALQQDGEQSNSEPESVTDKSSLLENMETLSIDVQQKYNASDQTIHNADINSTKTEEEQQYGIHDTIDDTITGSEDKTDLDASGETKTNTTLIAEPNSTNTKTNSDLTKPEAPISQTSIQNNGEHLDIVRKMSQSRSSNDVPWQKIGTYQTLKQKSCQRLYAATKRSDDIALFFHNGRFHAMEAWCTHMGGPLFQGDIEDYNGRSHVMCPWHSYMFDLQTGNNEIGLKQKIYELKYESGCIWVRYHCAVTTEPVNRKMSTDQSGTSTEINIQKVKARKKSALDSPMSLS